MYPVAAATLGRPLDRGLGAVDAAFPAALWSLYDSTGIRPEWVVPVLYSESGLNPAAQNSIGCVGINQACPFSIPTPSDYTSWSASQQMNSVVTPMYKGIVAKYGSIGSGTRAYQANFLPASMPTCTSLTSVLASQNGGGECWSVSAATSASIYSANPGFDYQKKGNIQLGDLAHFIAKSAANSYVQQVIASAYALRPSETETDPVYGVDFGGGSSTTQNVAAFLGTIAIGGAALWALHEFMPPAARARANPLHREQMIRCGLHSGFPPCCVSYFVNVWVPNGGTVAGMGRTMAVRAHARALQRARVGYIPCPSCLAQRRIVRVRSCRCARG